MKNIEEARFGEEDLLYRKGIAETLIKLFRSDNNFSHIVLDGGWGSGKSFFCHQLKNLILDEKKSKHEEKRKLQVVYINAFQFDYTDDPFSMILGNILDSIGYKYKNKRKFISHIQSIFKQAPKIFLKIFFKQGTKTIINRIPIPNEYKQVLKETCQEIYKLDHKNKNTTIDEILKSFGQMKKQISAFKDVLQKVISNTNMVVIIDELDRCRPSFAIEVLERVKHIFDIPNVHFLLSMDTQVLEATIKKLYGHEQNAEEYLNKFYTHKITLPSTVKISEERATFALFKEKIKKENIIDYTKKVVESYYKYKDPLSNYFSLTHSSKIHSLYNNRELPDYILHIAKWLTEEYNITLREIDKVLANIQLYYSLQEFPQSFEEAIVEFYALFLYVVDKKLFNEFKNKTLSLQDYKGMIDKIVAEANEPKAILLLSLIYIINSIEGSSSEIMYYLKTVWEHSVGETFGAIYRDLFQMNAIFPKIEETLQFFSH